MCSYGSRPLSLLLSVCMHQSWLSPSLDVRGEFGLDVGPCAQIKPVPVGIARTHSLTDSPLMGPSARAVFNVRFEHGVMAEIKVEIYAFLGSEASRALNSGGRRNPFNYVLRPEYQVLRALLML